MVDQMGNVKIMDFGIARLMDSARITSAGGICGTPAHVSGTSVGRPATSDGHLFSRPHHVRDLTVEWHSLAKRQLHCLKQTKEIPIRRAR